MQTKILGQNVSVSEKLRMSVEERMEKLDKFFHENVKAEVRLSHEKNQKVAEITIPLKNNVFLRAQETSFDMDQSIDRAIEKMERRVRKHKTAIHKRYSSGESIRYEGLEEPEQPEESLIVKSKRFPIKPMDPEEAVLQMKLLGHDFFVFRNADTQEINVIYERKQGGIGLIEPGLDE